MECIVIIFIYVKFKIVFNRSVLNKILKRGRVWVKFDIFDKFFFLLSFVNCIYLEWNLYIIFL